MIVTSRAKTIRSMKQLTPDSAADPTIRPIVRINVVTRTIDSTEMIN